MRRTARSGSGLDSADAGYFAISSQNYRRFFNVLTHEHGHGLGIAHVCPINNTKLMEEHFNHRSFGKKAEGRVEVFADVQFKVNESCLKSMHRGILLSEAWQIARLFPKKMVQHPIDKSPGFIIRKPFGQFHSFIQSHPGRDTRDPEQFEDGPS